MEHRNLGCLIRVLDTPTCFFPVAIGVGVAFACFGTAAFRTGTLETTPRVNKPIPRLAYEISIVPEVELTEKTEDEDEIPRGHYEAWSIFKHYQPPQLETYIAIAGFPLFNIFRAGFTEWTAYEIPARLSDIKSRLQPDEKTDLEDRLRKMDPLAFSELQRLLESKRLAGREGRSANDVTEVVMLKCIQGPSDNASVLKSRWNYLRWFKQQTASAEEVEYVAVVRVRRAREPSAWKQPRNLNFGSGWIGWQMMGSHPGCYERTIELLDETGVCISFASKEGLAPAEGFGAMAQILNAHNYRAKKVKMSAYVKSEAVEHWAGLWMRVDGPDRELHSFDNMEDRPIKGTTEWERYEIVLPVYEESFEIFFGVLLDGGGKLWLRDFQLEIGQ